MTRPSNRFIFAYWDDHRDDLWSFARRSSRCHEHMHSLPQLVDTCVGHLRHIYIYGRKARIKRFDTSKEIPNHLFYRTTSRYRPGRGTDEFALFVTALKMVVVSWEPYVCGVTTKALKALFPDPGPFRETWMLYIGPDEAQTVTPPDVPVVELTPDGGLLLAATKKQFNTEDADHVEGARRIGLAVRHLNVERPLTNAPWPAYPGLKSMNFYDPRDELWLGRALHKIVPDQELYPDATNPHVTGRVGPE